MTYNELIIGKIHDAMIDLVRDHREAGLIGVECATDGAILKAGTDKLYVISLRETVLRAKEDD